MIHQLGEQIGTKLAKAEEMGAEGNVDESLKFMEEVEELKKKKSAAEVGTSVPSQDLTIKCNDCLVQKLSL